MLCATHALIHSNYDKINKFPTGNKSTLSHTQHTVYKKSLCRRGYVSHYQMIVHKRYGVCVCAMRMCAELHAFACNMQIINKFANLTQQITMTIKAKDF